MQTDRTFIDELKYQYSHGGMHVKLIFVNVLVFVLISLLNLGANLGQNAALDSVTNQLFTLQTDFALFLQRPWGLFTSIFAHFNLIHLAFNMLMLYFAGNVFLQFFGNMRLLSLYILGGIVGGLIEILAHSLLPSLSMLPYAVVGASGSIMAIFIGLSFYKPNIPISLFGLFQFPIIYLALLYLVSDFISLGLNDGTAHFAHLGGAMIGIIFSQKPMSSSNFVYKFELLLMQIERIFKRKNKVKVHRKSAKNVRKMTDDEFNGDKKQRQEIIDQILDKISKSGYESLTKAEKEYLFKQSNPGG